jgi:hypothetical protein
MRLEILMMVNKWRAWLAPGLCYGVHTIGPLIRQPARTWKSLASEDPSHPTLGVHEVND